MMMSTAISTSCVLDPLFRMISCIFFCAALSRLLVVSTSWSSSSSILFCGGQQGQQPAQQP